MTEKRFTRSNTYGWQKNAILELIHGLDELNRKLKEENKSLKLENKVLLEEMEEIRDKLTLYLKIKDGD